jgi:hypothetical protein
MVRPALPVLRVNKDWNAIRQPFAMQSSQRQGTPPGDFNQFISKPGTAFTFHKP